MTSFVVRGKYDPFIKQLLTQSDSDSHLCSDGLWAPLDQGQSDIVSNCANQPFELSYIFEQTQMLKLCLVDVKGKNVRSFFFL
jgi:hypothetical protein